MRKKIAYRAPQRTQSVERCSGMPYFKTPIAGRVDILRDTATGHMLFATCSARVRPRLRRHGFARRAA